MPTLTREELAGRSRQLLTLPVKLRHIARPIVCPAFSLDELVRIADTLGLLILDILFQIGMTRARYDYVRSYGSREEREALRGKFQEIVRDAVLLKQRRRKPR